MGILTIDVVGVLRGWRRLDHWGHLGGAAAGAAWGSFGDDIWRESLLGAERMRVAVKEWREGTERKRRRRREERRPR